MNLGKWFGLVVLLGALYILWRIHQLLLLVFTAVVLAIAINRLVEWFQKLPARKDSSKQFKRPFAVLLSLGVLLGVLILAVVLVVPPFITEFQQLINLLPVAFSQFQVGINWLETEVLEPFGPNLPDINVLIQRLQPFVQQILQRSFQFFSTYVNVVVEVLIVLVLAMMMLFNPRPYRHIFIRLFPSFYRRRADEILARCQVSLEHWVTGALIEMVFVGFLSGLSLWILQVPLVLAHATVTGILNFIPNIGPTLSAIPPMAIAFLDAPWKAVAVLIIYIIIQQLESFWITPTVMARQVELLPAITLTAQLFFAGLFGLLGLLIALPLTVVAKTWLEEVLLKDILDQWDRPGFGPEEPPPEVELIRD